MLCGEYNINMGGNCVLCFWTIKTLQTPVISFSTLAVAVLFLCIYTHSGQAQKM